MLRVSRLVIVACAKNRSINSRIRILTYVTVPKNYAPSSSEFFTQRFEPVSQNLSLSEVKVVVTTVTKHDLLRDLSENKI